MASISSTSSSSNALRITGMASGLDVDSTVKQLMSAYNTKLDKMKQDRQLVQWRQDLYREIISDVKTFSSTYFDQLNRDNYMLSPNSYAGFDITATNSTGSSAITSATATAGVNATAGQYLVKVTQLAQPATITANPAYTTSTKLTDLGTGYSASNIELIMNYDSTVNKTITLDNSSGTKTVGDLINAINSQTSGKVLASFSELTGKFTLKTTKVGSASSIEVTVGTSNLANDSDLATDLGIKAQGIGKDAQVRIAPPGVTDVENEPLITKTSNSFTLDGVTYSLNRENTLAGEHSVINISKNTDATFDKIKGFIDKYNEMIDKIKTKVEERRELNYSPLTDAQKEEMTEEQITKWESKAKSGILKGDLSLDTMLSSLRKAFYDKVKDAGITLSEVGLSTSDVTSERGKIILTKDSNGEYKLKNALKNHGAELVNLFTQESTTNYNVDNNAIQRKTRYEENGIFQRIKDIINNYTTSSFNNSGHRGILIDKAGTSSFDTRSSIYKDLNNRDKSIEEMKAKLQDKENNYYKQFSSLETYLNKMNSQSSWLSQQLGG